jgi:hypothetical protein
MHKMIQTKGASKAGIWCSRWDRPALETLRQRFQGLSRTLFMQNHALFRPALLVGGLLCTGLLFVLGLTWLAVVGLAIFVSLLQQACTPHRLRMSWYSSLATHLLLIVVVPWLLTIQGCQISNRVPDGRGKPDSTTSPPPTTIQITTKKQKRKNYLVNPLSAIAMVVPSIEELLGRDLNELDTRAQLQYVASKSIGKDIGTGENQALGDGDGKDGGWPSGFSDGLFRFIRLNHGGSGWDDGMAGKGDSDRQFLAWFRSNGNVKFPVASEGEAITIRQLAQFRKGEAPPFVFLTGNRNIPASNDEVTILREYLQAGSMLFADCSSPAFHQSFRNLMARVFPQNILHKISQDDPIFTYPNNFASIGFSPLWSHGGTLPMGVRIDGRLAVFYHPGDVHDAWKTGHEGLPPQKWQNALMVGYNVVYHSVTNYVRATQKDRKR